MFYDTRTEKHEHAYRVTIKGAQNRTVVKLASTRR